MARRSREEDIVRSIAAIVLLLALGWTFSPPLRHLIVLVVIIPVGVGIVCVAILVVNRLTNSKPLQVLERGVDWERSGVLLQASSSKTTLSEQLRRIDWFQFEKLMGLVYQNQGFAVKRVGGANPDGGVDILVESVSEKFVVQCKRWNKWKIGVRQIREFLGTLADTGIKKGIFITLRGYTDDARSLAEKHGIRLLDEPVLVQMFERVGGKQNKEIADLLNDTRKFCPKCEREMVLRTANWGFYAGRQFWGCSSYPRCKFKMKLDGEM